MLNASEKAYYLALKALKDRDYGVASEQFEKAAPMYRENKEFVLLRKSVQLLLAVKKEIAGNAESEKLEILETFSNG